MNKFNGHIAITIDDNDYDCYIDFAKIVEIELALQKGIIELTEQAFYSKLTFTQIAQLIHVVIADKKLSLKQVGESIMQSGFKNYVPVALNILLLANGQDLNDLKKVDDKIIDTDDTKKKNLDIQ